MWPNSVWGFYSFSFAFLIAVLVLTPEQIWLRPYFIGGSILCFALGTIILCWPLRKSENRGKLRDAYKHPLRWIAKTVQPYHIILLGLLIALVGVAWQYRHTFNAPDISTITKPLQDQIDALKQQLADAGSNRNGNPQANASSDAHKPIYTVEEIDEMLRTLRTFREIVDQKTAPAYWATQEFQTQRWSAMLMNDGALAIAAKLEAIRDPIREAQKQLTRLLYDEQHYDAELHPVITGYDFAYGWMDGATTALIDALKKYSAADKGLLGDLIRGPYQEWNNDINAKFGQWIGQADARITQKTKELREWPRVADTRPIITQPAQGPVSPFAPEPRTTTVQWNMTFGTSRAVDLVFALFLDGNGPASKSVKLADAYLQSAITGEIIKMKVGSTNPLDDAFPISDANPIPPSGFIRLVAIINPVAPTEGLPNKIFLDDWKQTWFHAIYENDKPDDILFDEKLMGSYFPELSGPHVTRRLDAQKK